MIRMIYATILIGVGVLGATAWTWAARTGYESAQYKVLESQGPFEIREYPELTLAATSSERGSQGRDGSFMRLFRYISGANEADQKIAMTTPVFMQEASDKAKGSMGFVMPQQVAEKGVPEPRGEGVQIRERRGGRFAVIRFSGRLTSKAAEQQEAKLREWIESQGIEAEATAETAGYDAPFTPGPFRRNEVLIRLK